MSLSRFLRLRKRPELERKGPARKKSAKADTSTSVTKRRPLSQRLLPIIIVFCLWLICAFAILYRTPRSTVDLVRDQQAATSVVALVDFGYVDLSETEEARREAAGRVLDYYRIDTAAKEETIEDFQRLFEVLEESVREEAGEETIPPVEGEEATDGEEPPTDETAPAADEQAPEDDMPAPSEQELQTVERVLAPLDDEELTALLALFDSQDKRSFFLQSLNAVLLRGIVSPQRLEEVTDPEGRRIHIVDEYGRRQTVQASDLLKPSAAAENLVERLVERFPVWQRNEVAEVTNQVIARLIYPNLRRDAARTLEAREEAREEVAEVKKLVTKGTVFIEKGRSITEQDLLKLQAHANALKESGDIRREMINEVSLLVLSLLVIIVGALFLKRCHAEISSRPRLNMLLGILVGVNILLVWLIEEGMLLAQVGAPLYVYPALPLTLTAVLAALLWGPRMGLTACVFVPALAALSGGESLHVFILGLVSGTVGVLAVHRSRTRVQTFRAVPWMALAVFLVEAVYLVLHVTPWQYYLVVLGIAVVATFVMMLVANMLLPLAEWLFGLTTNISLLELSDLNHPLLKRLQLEAPGTYHHTLMVATLAEHAAEAIGANTLLARVAAYFHDIGKLSNPAYFTENSSGQDRHGELSPRMSSMVILNHVKEGLQMATKYKLKDPIREAIATHHGTSLVYYFYRRALDSNKISDASEEEDYRYPGPPPQSREATIISLADSCEAASRSLEKPTPQKIDAQVAEIFRNKLVTGQLEHSQLTMAELTLVIETIKKTLHTMLHGRVAYPKYDESETGQSAKKAAVRRPENAGEGTDTVPDTQPLSREDIDDEGTGGEALSDGDHDAGRDRREPGQQTDDGRTE